MRRNTVVIGFFCLLGGVAVSKAVSSPPDVEGWDYAPDEIIVKFKARPTQNYAVQAWSKTLPGRATPLFRGFRRQNRHHTSIQATQQGFSTPSSSRQRRAPKNVVVPDLSRLYRVQVDGAAGEDLLETLTIYQADPDVEYAELNYRARLCYIPNDPNYPQQWALSKIQAASAWDIHTGDTDVVVAVIDTGVNFEHRDLEGNLWVNTAEQNGTAGIDDDGNGYVDDISGYDFANDDGDPSDDHSHGSHVIGTIAARGDNSYDMAGICWDVTVMPIKALDPDTLGAVSGISEAVYYAVANGADVISNSWGMNPPSQALRESFEYAYSQGVICVAAAGNDNRTNPFYPAAYSQVISVGASNANDRRANFSNHGSWVDLFAPGQDILSLVYWGQRGVWPMSGTSMACPHVAGSVALMLAINPYLSFSQVRQALMDSSDLIEKKTQEGRRGQSPAVTGLKRLNLHQALTAVLPQQGRIHLDRDIYGLNQTIAVQVTDANGPEGVVCVADLRTTAGDQERLVLLPDSATLGVYRGVMSTQSGPPQPDDGFLQVTDGDTIQAEYQDITTENHISRDTALVDGQSPQLLNLLVVGAESPHPRIELEASEPVWARLAYGSASETNPDPNFVQSILFKTEHILEVPTVLPETTYALTVTLTDEAGNSQVLEGHEFTTGQDPVHIYVPDDYATIQAGLDHCWPHGTVWIADDTYTGPGNRDLDCRGKPITVRSVNGPESCIIDCQGAEGRLHRGFYFHRRETPATVLDGIQIKGGYQVEHHSNGTLARGGGILCNGASPTIRNCILRDNTAYLGGGIHAYQGSSPIVTNCVFERNRATNRGAGMWCDGCPQLTDCRFHENVGNSYFGGLYVNNFEDPENDCTVLTRCIFLRNTTRYGGGAAGFASGRVILKDCRFSGNNTDLGERGRGGALHVSFCNLRVENSLFVGNGSGESGGAFFSYHGQNRFFNCTFAENRSPLGRSAFLHQYTEDPAVIDIRSCILWNGGGEFAGEGVVDIRSSYSCVQGGYPGIGNIDLDPLFVKPGVSESVGGRGRVPQTTWVEGDYHLQSQTGHWDSAGAIWIRDERTSPCIDAGDPAADFSAEPEPHGSRINMGAYGGTIEASLSK